MNVHNHAVQSGIRIMKFPGDRIRLFGVLAFSISLLNLSPVFSHPSTPNEAIKAPTLAELYVQEGEVRLELEIGEKDRAVFKDLFSDGAKEEVTAAQRRFMDRGFVIEADDEPLRGRVTLVEPRQRVLRETITGERWTGTTKEPVIFVEVRYPMKGKPSNIHIKPPKADDGATGTIGLVAWHRSIPVCDFDFLKLPVSFRLDWADPWNSKFRGIRFQRYWSIPLWATLSIEPRMVRVEMVVRPGVGSVWLDPASKGLPPTTGLMPALGERVRDWLVNHLNLTVDGQPVTLQAEQVRYLHQKLCKIENSTGNNLPPEAAYYQLSYHVPVPARPREVTLKLDVFNSAAKELVLWVNSSTNPPKMTAAQPTFTWKDQSMITDALILVVPEVGHPWWLPVPSAIIAVIGFLWIVPGFPPFRQRFARLIGFLVVIALAGGLWSVGQVELIKQNFPELSPEQSQQLAQRLLTDSYRAFDCREEEAVYDTLADSVSGPLLRETYLNIRKMIDAPNQIGQARVRDTEVKSATSQLVPDGQGYIVQATWVIEVAITHYGHTHTRRSHCEGELTIRPHEGRWKIDAMNVQDIRPLAEKPQ